MRTTSKVAKQSTSRLSILQQYYINLYKYLDSAVDFAGFPRIEVDYLKELLYTKAQIGTAIGNTETVDPSDILKNTGICNDDGSGEQYPIYQFRSPPINAIGDTVKQISIAFSNSTDTNAFYYDKFSTPKLEQIGMHTPITDFTAPILMNFGTGPFKVTLSSIAENHSFKNNEEVPGGFVVDTSACK